MIQKTKTKLNELGFQSGHYGLIAFAVLAIAMLSFMQSPLTLENLVKFQFTQADLQEEIELSVADAISKAESEIKGPSEQASESFANYKREQLSLLDPSFGDGSVLGVSTEAQETINNILSEQAVNKIPIKVVSDNELGFEEYSAKSRLIESHYSALSLLAVLGAQDKNAISKTLPVYQQIIGELQSLEVPESFARYHRLKLMYFTTVMTMAQSIVSDASLDDRAAAGILFFEIGNEMEQQKSELISNFGVEL